MPDNTPTTAHKAQYKSLSKAHAVIKQEMGPETLEAVKSKETAYERTYGKGPEVKAKILEELNKGIQVERDAKQKGYYEGKTDSSSRGRGVSKPTGP